MRQDESNVAAITNEKRKKRKCGVDKLIRFVSIVASMVSSVFGSTNSRWNFSRETCSQSQHTNCCWHCVIMINWTWPVYCGLLTCLAVGKDFFFSLCRCVMLKWNSHFLFHPSVGWRWKISFKPSQAILS